MPVDSWQDYKVLITDWIRGESEILTVGRIDEWWFRGQGSAANKLTSSLDRRLKTLDINVVRKIESDMIEAFRERAVQSISNAHTDDEVLAILQHYGAPTRLLDWSSSPYVAAFFALSSAQAVVDDDDFCAVWALAHEAPIWKSGAGVSIVQPSFGENQRALMQRGSFTRNSSYYLDIETFLEKNPSPTKDLTLIKFEIPREDASSGLKDLSLMTITSESLFPGLEGAARYAFFRALDKNGQLT